MLHTQLTFFFTSNNLKSAFSDYGLISNFKINLTKSEIINLKYIGILRTALLHKFFQTNYMPPT